MQNESQFESLKLSANPPMILVTTAVNDELAGCLVGFHAQSSMQPLQYSFWLSKANHTYVAALRASHFVAHFLTANDLNLAEHFGGSTGHRHNKFAEPKYRLDAHGTPVLLQCQHRLTLERIAVLDTGGDHVCITAAVVEVESTTEFNALRLRDVQHITPGRQEDERAVQP